MKFAVVKSNLPGSTASGLALMTGIRRSTDGTYTSAISAIGPIKSAQ
jgi:hypothetical protein